MTTATRTSEFQEDAQLVIDVLSEKEQVQLDYSTESISWLDNYIDEHRADLNDGDKLLLQEKFGAFLGESILRNFGGRWVRNSDNHWMIAFGETVKASPFELIAQHLDHHTALSHEFQHIPDQIGRKAAQN